MSDANVKVWGLWEFNFSRWAWSNENIAWSFDHEQLQGILDRARGWQCKYEVREMSEFDIAKVPEAAAAVVALLDMRTARVRLNAAKISGWGNG